MAKTFGRNRNRRNNSGEQKREKFEAPKRIMSICNHKLSDTQGAVLLYEGSLNKEEPEILQGDLEMINLTMIDEILDTVKDTNEELSKEIVMLYIPDSLVSIVNGTIADFVRTGRYISGDIIDEDKLELYKSIANKKSAKDMNIILRLYQYMPNELTDKVVNWSKSLFDDYVKNGMRQSSTKSTSKEEAKTRSLQEQIEAATEAQNWDLVDRLLSIQERVTAQMEAQAKLKESSEKESQQEVEA